MQSYRNYFLSRHTSSSSEKKKKIYLLPITLFLFSSFFYFNPVFTTTPKTPNKDEFNTSLTTTTNSNNTQLNNSIIYSNKNIPTKIKNLEVEHKYILLDDIAEFITEEEQTIGIKKIETQKKIPYKKKMIPLHQKVRNFSTYKVKKGDSLWLIAKKKKISIDSIISANNIQSIYMLKINQILKIPFYEGLFYKIKKDDTLVRISKKYKIKIAEIKKFNQIKGKKLQKNSLLFLNKAKFSQTKRNQLFGGLFIKPLAGIISSRYGMRKHPIKKIFLFHTGIDIASQQGAKVKAASAGKVVYSGTKGGYGNYIEIKHDFNYTTVYSHLSKLYVKKGQMVKQGEAIGEVGETGIATAPHLHFEIKNKNKYINPQRFIHPNRLKI